MTDATVGFLLENLKQLLIYNADLIGGVQDNVKELCEDLDTLRGFIKEYTRKHNNNEILKALVKEIRNVVNEAEDAIETFLVEASIQEHRSFMKKALHMFDYPFKLRSVAKEIQSVREKVKDIYQNKAAFGFEALQIDEDSGRGSNKKESPVVEEDNVVGFDGEAKKVIELLTGDSEELQVISIIGMPGLGKTTLAKKILHDPRIEYEFNTRAFIYLSQEYNRREVLFAILGALTQITPEMSMMSDGMLAEATRINLKAKKYLIVIDDVWTREAWDDIKIAFPNNSKSSRLLITSRNRYVALHANPIIQPHDMKFLTLDGSRNLLRRRVFGSESCPPDLEEYELHIAQKCGGVPQAVISIAGILLNNRDRTSWWKKVSESVGDYFSRDQGQGNDVITLSYNHLPFHLKPCFLYLGVFREEFEIPVWILLQLWIAEGLIQPEGDVCLEDLAEEYLEELVDRDLVMVAQRKSNGTIKTCRVRNTLREFCKKEALEENLFHEIRRFDSFATSNPSLDNYRRLCINSNFSEYIHSKPSGAHVRSLLSFAKEEIVLDPEYISCIPEAFKLLRVLDIKSSINFTSFPENLCDLVLLKYLAISGDFDILPAEISNLWNMQTLIIETSSRSIRVEADIWKLFLLRHFHTKASANLLCPPPKTHTGKEIRANLQTLSTISPESCQKDVFERTPRLKKLGIRGKLAKLMEANGECSLFDFLYKLEFLESLKLINDDSYSKLYVLPHENKFPAKLTKLTLFNTLLDWKHISTLGKLGNLEVLKLKENAFMGEWWQTEDGEFRHLKVLHIGKTNLVVWKASAHHFPILRSLILRNCTVLEAVPSGLAEIPSLQTIELFCTNASVASSARKIQILKLQIQAQEGIKGSGFKLSIYPPDQ